jgi:lysine N6-hydroxylase
MTGAAPRVHDLVGVGIGPFNLSLAALADPMEGLDALFLDAKPAFAWHPGMMIAGTTLQVPFLADLVTLVDPTSRWSFLAYLRDHDRLFPFYFAERFHVPRREYEHYCRWVAESLSSCRFGASVESLSRAGGTFEIGYRDRASGRAHRVLARNVVLGVGTEPVMPEALRPLAAEGTAVFHSASYLERRPALAAAGDVTVIGSGQSGAEVFCDLLRAGEGRDRELRWLTRSPAFAPMEHSTLGLEQFSPDYTRYVRTLAQETRDRLVPGQWQLYKAISAETIAEISGLLYERGLGGRWPGATLMPNVAVTAARRRGGRLELACHHREQDRRFLVETDAVVAATGYASRRPPFLDPLAGLVLWDGRGRYRVDDQFRVACRPELEGGLYVQNAELHTHGVGAPDLGLGAWRSAVILGAICRRPAYRLPRRAAFTTFGAQPCSSPQD